MVDRGRRFLLKVPPGYFDMTEGEQQVATRAMWREVMTQIGEDPDRLISDRALPRTSATTIRCR